MEKKLEDNILELRKRIAKCNLIINDLEHNQAFNEVLNDFKEKNAMIDNAWHLIDDIHKLTELRIMKLAASSIVNVIDTYKADLRMAQEQLVKLENPTELINKEWDTE